MQMLRRILSAPGSCTASWIALPLSILVGLAFYLATANSIEKDSETRFFGYANTAANTIAARVKSHNDLVRSAAALFQSTYPVGRVQFADFVASLGLETNFPAIETLNYAAYVTDRDRDSFERSIRADLPPAGAPASEEEFAIYPPGRRPHYYVVTLVHPAKRNGPVGADLAIDPVRLAFFLRGRDTGQIITSGIPIRKSTEKKGTSIGVRLSVYARHLPVTTLEQRRRAYLGAVGIAFSVDALVKGVIDEMPVKNARMTLVDREPGRLGQRRLLIDTADAAPPSFTVRPLQFTRTLPIDFNGRQWEATFTAYARDMYSPFEQYIAWLALLAGMVATLLLYALFDSLMSSRLRAIRLARGMTRELRESKAKLQVSHENLRQLAAHADSIKEYERKRIAREIHDDLGQNLLALRIDATMLAARTKGRQIRLHERAADTVRHIDGCIKSVRQIINNLRPNVLDLGLSAAVEWQVGEFERRTSLKCELIDDSDELTFHEQVATGFLRILQESLSHIVRHAHATSARVVLRSTDGAFSMTISDDGVGLPQSGHHRPGSFGLIGIEERVRLFGGSCNLSSAQGGGAVIALSVPLDRCALAVADDDSVVRATDLLHRIQLQKRHGAVQNLWHCSQAVAGTACRSAGPGHATDTS